MVRPAPYQLIILGILGAISIWGFIGYWSHMFDNFDAIVASGRLPDGSIVRMSYTGVKALDHRITPVIAFYSVLSNGRSVGPRMLFFDINFVVACSNIWVLVESRRRGLTSSLLKYPFIFIILGQFTGAALIQSHYLYLIVQSNIQLRGPTIPGDEAIAIANALPRSWIDGNNSSAGTLLGTLVNVDKPTETLEQFHLFTQFDWMVVTMSTVVFVYLLLSMTKGKHVGLELLRSRDKEELSVMEKRDLCVLLLATVLLGPGAAGSLGMAVRESRLRRKLNKMAKLQ